MPDLSSIPDFGLGWLDASGPHSDIVLSTRVRLARNLQGRAFGARARVNDRDAVLEKVRQVAGRVSLLEGAAIVSLPETEMRTRGFSSNAASCPRTSLGRMGEARSGVAR